MDVGFYPSSRRSASMATSRSRSRTPEPELARRTLIGYSTHSLRRKPAAWEWGCGSAVRLSRPMRDSYGQLRTPLKARYSDLHYVRIPALPLVRDDGPMLKCSSDRCVCAPHSLSAGTSTTPRLSVS